MKKKSGSKSTTRKKAKKPVRDLQALEPRSRRVVGGARAGRRPLGKRI